MVERRVDEKMIELSDLRFAFSISDLVQLSDIQEAQLAREIEELLLEKNIICDVRVRDLSYFVKRVGKK
jgi:hypothetical protein